MAGLRSFGRWLVDWYRAQTVALRVLLVAITLLAGKLVDQALDFGKHETGLAPWLIAGGFIALCALAAFLSLILHRARKPDPWPPIDKDTLEVRRMFSPDELVRIRTGLHAEIYGGVAPESEQIDRIYAKNPRVGVALRDPGRDDYVAFATGWPLTPDAARRLMNGSMTENDLTSKDVLMAGDNDAAEFVLVPAFGASGAGGDGERIVLAIRLFHEFRRTLRHNFFSAGDRTITIIATAFSEDGERWCLRNHMVEKTQVHLAGVPKPLTVFAKPITLADVD